MVKSSWFFFQKMLCEYDYDYIWCFAANVYFKIMIANVIIQCDWTLRPEKLWGKG